MLTSHSWPGQVTIPFWRVVSGAICKQWVFKGLHTSRESFDNSFVTQQDVSTLSFLQPLALFLCSIFLIAKEHTVAPFLPQTAFCRQGSHSLLLFSYLSLASSTHFGLHCAPAGHWNFSHRLPSLPQSFLLRLLDCLHFMIWPDFSLIKWQFGYL